MLWVKKPRKVSPTTPKVQDSTFGSCSSTVSASPSASAWAPARSLRYQKALKAQSATIMKITGTVRK